MALLCPPLNTCFARYGVDLAGAKIFTYYQGTTTKADTCTDSTEATANANPGTFDANGEFPLWLKDNISYDIYIYDKSEVFDPPQSTPLCTALNVSGNSQFITTTVTGNTTLSETDINRIILVNAASGNVVIIPPVAADVGNRFIFYVKKIDATANTVTINPPGSTAIDGALTFTLSTQYESVAIFTDGIQWYTLNLRQMTEMRDVNNALVANTTAVTNPVNYLQFLHSAATDPVQIKSLGTDSTIPIKLTPKGDAAVQIPSTASLENTYYEANDTIGHIFKDEDSRTNSVKTIATFQSTTSGTPAAGIGTGIEFKAESADENPCSLGKIDFITTDVTAGSEDTYMSTKLRVAGAAASEAYRYSTTTAFSQLHTHSNTANRTITWPDTNLTMSQAFFLPRAPVYASTTNVATGTTLIPLDDTAPQITEGTEFLTASITPLSATNKLTIRCNFYTYSSSNNVVILALFQDSSTFALAATASNQQTGISNIISLTYQMTAGTTSSTTFRVRIGPSTGGTITLNGSAGSRLLGGVLTSSIEIWETAP